MLPLSVALALKQWPMALFATPFFTNLGVDRTAFWHRWVGRIVWILATVHSSLWIKQLLIDLDPFNQPTWNVVWKWHRLVAGGIVRPLAIMQSERVLISLSQAYVALTLMVALSFKPLRKRFYEIFYYSHVLLTLVFLATIIIHYEALQGWCLLAAGLWGLERLARLSIFLYLNFGRGLPLFGEGRAGKAQFRSTNASETGFKVHTVEKRLSVGGLNIGASGAGSSPYGSEEWSAASRSTQNLQNLVAPHDNRNPVYAYGDGNDEIRSGNTGRSVPGVEAYTAVQPDFGQSRYSDALQSQAYQNHRTQRIPRGYALAQLLPGKVIKLTLHTPRHLSWKPGQYVMLTTPSVRWWQGHPYSISNAQNLTEQCLASKPKGEERSGSEIVLLMSVRRGFSKRLYNDIIAKRKQLVGKSSSSYTSESKTTQISSDPGGILLRVQTHLPAGSSARIRWDDHSTVVLVAAGTGITYILSVLEHLCCELATKNAALRDGEPSLARRHRESKRPTHVNRIRFVWILREYCE